MLHNMVKNNSPRTSMYKVEALFYEKIHGLIKKKLSQ